MAKLLCLLVALVSISANAGWYHPEPVHNAVHELELELAKLPPRFESQDSRELRRGVAALADAIDHIHNVLHAGDNQDKAEVILEAFLRSRTPFRRFVRAVRRNHVRTGNKSTHVFTAFAVMDHYGQLEFWMTPVGGD